MIERIIITVCVGLVALAVGLFAGAAIADKQGAERLRIQRALDCDRKVHL